MLTFEKFRATRQFCSDLRQTAHRDLFREDGSKPIGLIYLDELFIEIFDGEFHMIIGAKSSRSDDLETLERELYEFAASQGLL